MCSVNVSAQDVIVKKDGSTILSKVLEINTDDIKYKKYSNPNGPTYQISKSEIFAINYENGDKDDFSKETERNNSQQPRLGLIKKSAAANNDKIIKLHNVVHPNFNGGSSSKKACSTCTVKFGIKSTSIISNEDVEMEFVRKVATGYDYDDELCYYINIRNKTDRVLYIDKGNCFKIYNDGYSYCYYDASNQTTVNNGGSSGVSVNVGSFAGALGIGGTIGQIASGVNVGGGKSNSVSNTYVSQRFIAIPPHGSKYLTEYIWVGQGKKRTCVERPEKFLPWSEHDFESTAEIGLRRGVVNKNDTRVFGENELLWKREFYITYSTDETFSSYSFLHAELYIQEVIGALYYGNGLLNLHKRGKWFQNVNTIVSEIWWGLDKK